MKIVIKNTIGAKKEFKDKEDFMRFAIRELENSIYSNDEEDELKWDILNGKEVSISDVMSLLHDYKMLQSEETNVDEYESLGSEEFDEKDEEYEDDYEI